MKNFKTTIAGFLIGVMPILYALSEAYASGYFTGLNLVQTVLGIATIGLGVWAKDPKKINNLMADDQESIGLPKPKKPSI